MTGTLSIILLLSAQANAAQRRFQRAPQIVTHSTPEHRRPEQPIRQQLEQVRLLKAFVIDDRLSALRREPSLQAVVIRRIRLAQPVYIVSSTPYAKESKPKFLRVAVTRRTRGWILASALAVPGRAGEDLRIMALIENSNDAVDRITLCRIIIEGFGRSRSVPRAMLLLAGEAERVATTLSQRTRRRLSDLRGSEANLRGEASLRGSEANLRGSEASLRDYYLSDAGLDRYSRLGIAFDFNETTGEFYYDGKAYREIVRRFPVAEESKLARQRLEFASRNRSQTQ
jgi:hypothetical protein